MARLPEAVKTVMQIRMTSIIYSVFNLEKPFFRWDTCVVIPLRMIFIVILGYYSFSHTWNYSQELPPWYIYLCAVDSSGLLSAACNTVQARSKKGGRKAGITRGQVCEYKQFLASQCHVEVMREGKDRMYKMR